MLNRLLHRLSKRLGVGAAAAAEKGTQLLTVAPPVSRPLFNGEPIPAYPEPGHALPAATAAMLITSQEELIDDLRRAIGLTTEQHATLLHPVVERYAEYVHLLPASEYEHHAGVGGLFRHGLEVAYHAARYCNGIAFANDVDDERRREHKPRWIMATIYASLLHDLAKSVVDVGAISVDGKEVWDADAEPLLHWLQRLKLDSYRIIWRPGKRDRRHDTSAIGMAVARSVIGGDILRWLGEHSGEAIKVSMWESLAPRTSTVDAKNVIHRIVLHCDRESVRLDNIGSRGRLAATGKGGANRLAAQYLRLIGEVVYDTGQSPNTPSGCAFNTTLGTFASTSLFEILGKKILDEKHAGLPTDMYKIIDYLMSAGMIEPEVMGTSANRVWRIDVELQGSGATATRTIDAVRFTESHYLFGDRPPPPPIKAVPTRQPIATATPAAQPAEAPAAAPVPAAEQPPAAAPAPPASAPAPAATASQPVQAAPNPALHPAPAPAPATSLSTPEPTRTSTAVSTADASSSPANPIEGEASTEAADGAGDEKVVVDRRKAMQERENSREYAKRERSATKLPDTPEGARDWFKAQGMAGAYVMTIAERALTGERVLWNRDVVLEEELVWLRVPGAMLNLGTEPLQVCQHIARGGLSALEVPRGEDAQVTPPQRRDGGTALPLSPDASEMFLRMCPPEKAATQPSPPRGRAGSILRTPSTGDVVQARVAPAAIDLSRMPLPPKGDERPSEELVLWIKTTFFRLVSRNVPDLSSIGRESIIGAVTGLSDQSGLTRKLIGTVLIDNFAAPAVVVVCGTEKGGARSITAAKKVRINAKFADFLNPETENADDTPEAA